MSETPKATIEVKLYQPITRDDAGNIKILACGEDFWVKEQFLVNLNDAARRLLNEKENELATEIKQYRDVIVKATKDDDGEIRIHVAGDAGFREFSDTTYIIDAIRKEARRLLEGEGDEALAAMRHLINSVCGMGILSGERERLAKVLVADRESYAARVAADELEKYGGCFCTTKDGGEFVCTACKRIAQLREKADG